MDTIFYKNYSFNFFHLQPANLVFPIILSFEAVILYFLTTVKTKGLIKNILVKVKTELNYFTSNSFGSKLTDLVIKRRKLDIKSTIRRANKSLVIAYVLLLAFGTRNLFVSVSSFVKNDAYMFTHPDLTYRQKMEQLWGILFYMVETVIDNTPDGSRILFPPEIAPWSIIGNIDQVRYFMGERVLLNAKDAYSIDGEPDYIIIGRGGLHAIYDVVKSEDEYGWPRVYVPAEKIWYLNRPHWTLTEVYKDYDPNDPMNKDAWGLIKVDKSRL
ncbi:MAG TPA: hypothetical protein VJ227_03385 [Patescibacteria group bacterium]|nr:hypothetical protein [Patescibacteria group bacterium]